MNTLIRKAMADAGVNSKAELSRISGVPYETINNVLSGKDVKLSTLGKIFDCMGFSLTYKTK
ncbi:transcriptional repressor [Pseudoalteromonas phage BS5]|uniref:transcriptional repressor n=1 Tax=Pseudoalteromonas phage BS5 TaxID=1874539 RepID=UPI0008198C74|nr:transcriptional repressor [Pseudoalteromonas phage BS5]ANY29601.1 hypothetical protein [Pseudoalteromonas phage BS5]